MKLDVHQQIAVDTRQQRLLLVAGAGSGKTRVLTEHALNTLVEVAPSRMLVLSFTRAAAAEAAARLGARVQQRGLAGFPEVGTYHSWLARMLRPHARELRLPQDFWIADEADEEDLLRAAAWTLGHPSPWTATTGELSTERILKEAEALRAQAGAVPYQLVEDYGLRLAKAGAFRGLYDVVLADEAQDLSEGQLRVLELLAEGGARLFLVGDPEQAIYGFRGARPDLLAAMPAQRLLLPTNYRSTPELVALANRIRDPAWGLIVPSQRDDGMAYTFTGPSRGACAVEAVRNMIGEGYSTEDIAVLCRSWATVDEVRGWLVTAGYPIAGQGDEGDPWTSPAGRWLRRLLRVLTRPGNPVLCALLHHPVQSIHAPFPVVDSATWWRAAGVALMAGKLVVSQLAELDHPFSGWGAVEATRRLLQINPPPPADLVLDTFYGLLEELVGQHPLGAGGRDLERIRAAAKGTLADLERQQAEGLDQRNPTTPGIVVGTVHGAKGLEYPAVVLPDLSAVDYPPLADARRLLYVAITRAKRALALGAPLQGRRQELLKPSHWLSVLA